MDRVRTKDGEESEEKCPTSGAVGVIAKMREKVQIKKNKKIKRKKNPRKNSK
jgi:hypothetical protein